MNPEEFKIVKYVIIGSMAFLIFHYLCQKVMQYYKRKKQKEKFENHIRFLTSKEIRKKRFLTSKEIRKKNNLK